MLTGLPDINQLIPQRPPFVMIDSLVASGEHSTSTRFTVREDNLLVEDGQFSEAGLLENIAQTAAARAGFEAVIGGTPVRIGYIGAVRNLSFFGLPKIKDELVTEITVENQIFDVTLVSGKVSCGERLLATCEMKIFIQPS